MYLDALLPAFRFKPGMFGFGLLKALLMFLPFTGEEACLPDNFFQVFIFGNGQADLLLAPPLLKQFIRFSFK
ncbi:MAG: hypothetical protein ACYC9M_08035 [Desulfobulbaceae bacterium]